MTTISLESFVAPKLPWVKTPIRAKVIEFNEFFLCEKKKKKKKSKVTRTLKPWNLSFKTMCVRSNVNIFRILQIVLDYE